jgi:hypothetical protein
MLENLNNLLSEDANVLVKDFKKSEANSFEST